MAFTTETRTINDIFQRTVQYQVPRYQRNYVWKEINWKELLNDIKFTVQNSDDMPWSHFLGAIVLNKVDTKDGVDIFEIIDGQQRLTTIYIVLMAICRRLLIINTEKSENRANYIHTTFLMSLNNQSQKITVVKNEEFEKSIHELIDKSKNKQSISKQNNYYKVYNYFDSEFKDYNFLRMTKFLDKLLDVNIVEIVSDQKEEIYNIFEVLNARGQKLKQIELLKNHVMKYIQPRNDEFIDTAKTDWHEIEDNISALSDQDNLIVHFAKCYLKKPAENSNSVYRLIKEEVEINNLSNFLKDLLQFSEIYKKVTNKQPRDEVIEYFNIKGNQQIRSLVTAIYLLEEKQIISSEVREEALTALRNFFFQFNVTQQRSNRTDKFVSKASFNVYHCQYENEFKFHFTDFLNKLNGLVDSEKVRETFYLNNSFQYSNKNSAMKKNSRLVKYTLKSLYNNIQQDTDTQIHSDDLAIEHLLSDNGSTEHSSMDNLTLTTAEINAQQLQNKPIVDKINILHQQSTIKANQDLINYLDPKDSSFDFEKRKKDLLNMILNNVFQFSPDIFNITKDELNKYFKISDVVKDDGELLQLLKENGKFFTDKLENDPSLTKQKERFDKMMPY